MTHKHPIIRLGFDIVKVGLKAAAVIAAFRTASELHRVHTAIEERRK